LHAHSSFVPWHLVASNSIDRSGKALKNIAVSSALKISLKPHRQRRWTTRLSTNNWHLLHFCGNGLLLKNFFKFPTLAKSTPQTQSRAWCKTIVTTSFYVRSYNSFAPSPRGEVCDFDQLIAKLENILILQEHLIMA